MLLEMIPDMPECAEDFLAWTPLSYAEHFTASNFKARELAISAYEFADPDTRAEFDQMAETMTSILNEVGAAMREATQDADQGQARRTGDRLAQAAGGRRRRRHQWRLRGRRRDHHGGLIAVVLPDPSTRPQLAVSAAIFRDGKVLLVRRARSPGKGFYSLPGGRVEFGESLHAGAGARGRRGDRACGSTSSGLPAGARCCRRRTGGGHYVIMSFAARWAAREPVLNDEHDDFKWLAPAAFGDLKLTGGLFEVVEAARRLVGG